MSTTGSNSDSGAASRRAPDSENRPLPKSDTPTVQPAAIPGHFGSIPPTKSDPPAVQPAAIPDEIRNVLNFEEERDPQLVQLATEEDAVLICAVAPYTSLRVSPVYVVSASIGLHEEFAFEAVIDEIITRSMDTKKIMLLLNTNGGVMHSCFKVARALRTTFKKMEIYVPHIAASGGTLVALAGDKIVMGLMSQLSPLDPQVPYNGVQISALTCGRFYERMCKYFEDKTKEEAPYPAQAIVEKIDPFQMEEWQRDVDTAEAYAKHILTIADYKPEDASRIAKALVRDFSQHDSDINYQVAKDLGLRVERHSDSQRNQRIWRHFRTWLGKFFMEESGTHVVRYVFPESERK